MHSLSFSILTRSLAAAFVLSLCLIACSQQLETPGNEATPTYRLTEEATVEVTRTSTIRPPTFTPEEKVIRPDSSNIRHSVLAGAWYPDDPEQLTEMIDTFLAAVKPIDGAPIALIAPHAGYVFSGPVAAASFKQLEGQDYDVAVIIASDHQPPLSAPISVWVGGSFETPLGLVPVDEALAEALIQSSPLIRFFAASHEGEHPIEIQLPFLQRVCPDCAILPILMGSGDEEAIRALVEGLVLVLDDRRAVIIASSDLSHYPEYKAAIAVDIATLGAIETGDAGLVQDTIRESMAEEVAGLVTCACGQAPIIVAMKTAEALGADTITLLRYANSGDSPFGEPDRVVGYGAVMFWHYVPPQLTAGRKAELLQLARDTITGYLESGVMPEYETDDPELLRKSGAYVTLKKNGELRGCIGHIRGDKPLHQVVQEMAVAAATSDKRFPPLNLEELNEIDIEVSVLSPLQRVADVEQIEVGIHGLMIFKDGRQGVLLPQVAVENGWDREQFLEQLCLKAGLPGNCWVEKAGLYNFSAKVFGETSS